MKRVGNLWPETCSLPALFRAAERAAAGKRKRPDVAGFLMNLEPEVCQLYRELSEGSYRPGPYRTFLVLDPKPRQISAAPFRDRVVHHALTSVWEPIFERRFSPNSFACRVGKGTHAAIRRAVLGASQCEYCLKCDVRKYFASIDHEILNKLLARVVKCRPSLALAAQIIEASNSQEEVIDYFPGDHLFTPLLRRRGLPLGNQTSQFFANVYLNPVDQYLDRVRPGGWFVRYVDDWLVFHSSKQWLVDTFHGLTEVLEGLRLRLHPGKTRVYQCREGISFLGWRVFPNRIRLGRENVVRFQRRMRNLQEDYALGQVAWDGIEASVRAWIAHADHGDTAILKERLLERYAFRATGGVGPKRAGRLVQQQCNEAPGGESEQERT